jgi:predicted  nucleic acid-binding Zn-ribbon protein
MNVNMTKAKDIAHEKRRAARSQEFAPWDIKATIPSEKDEAEAERQKIRDRYAEMQNQIDAAKDVAQLSALTPKV